LSTQTKANTSPVFFLTALPGGARQQSHSVCLSLLRALLQERQIPIRPPDQKARLSAALWPQEIHLPGGRERILSPGDDTHRESGGNAANTRCPTTRWAGACITSSAIRRITITSSSSSTITIITPHLRIACIIHRVAMPRKSTASMAATTHICSITAMRRCSRRD